MMQLNTQITSETWNKKYMIKWVLSDLQKSANRKRVIYINQKFSQLGEAQLDEPAH